MKKLAIILGIIIVTISGLAVVKNQVVKSAVTIGASTVLGAPVKIDSLSFGIFKQAIIIKGLKVYNPKDFPKDILVNMPVISVSYDLGAMLAKKIHLKRVEIDLKELNIVKNKEGKLNVDSLNVSKEQEKPPAGEKEKTAQDISLRIDELILTVGIVVYKDFTKGEKPATEVFDVNIERKTYKNITSAQQLAALILSEPLKQTAIKSAKIYAASAVLGVGFLPAGVALTLLGKDSAKETFDTGFNNAYAVSLSILEKSGSVTEKNKETGIIKAAVNKNDVTVRIEQKTPRSVEITVSAKRLLLPKPEIAKGILYDISDKIK